MKTANCQSSGNKIIMPRVPAAGALRVRQCIERKNEPIPKRLPLGRKQFPVALGDDFDVVVDHFDSGLVVNRVGRHWNLGSHFFHVGRGTFRVVLVIQVWKQRKVNQSQTAERRRSHA